ncbi:hypothetical protein Y032_0105g3658 [Ancylostoma ceylanicum]|uniref:Uncharacterized protein n=1 Tax=Ancylostoma ceylanicum TaxID=53326 RepID=A0A016TFZ5_9BILA|nr:hypothetical protein Y032_0105g3658 [Ancylostoma ceylanicum]
MAAIKNATLTTESQSRPFLHESSLINNHSLESISIKTHTDVSKSSQPQRVSILCYRNFWCGHVAVHSISSVPLFPRKVTHGIRLLPDNAPVHRSKIAIATTRAC